MASRSILTRPGEYGFDLTNQPINVRTFLEFTEFINEISEVINVNGKRAG
jgi:hypothetical protein